MKAIVYVLLAILLVGSAAAFTPESVEVDCGPDHPFWNAVSRHCDAGEVQDVADEIMDYANRIHYEGEDNYAELTQVNRNQNRKIRATNEYINDNEEAYLAGDGDGTSSKRILGWIDEVKQWARDLFVTKDELAISEARILVEVTGIGSVDCRAALIRASQTGEEHIIGTSLAKPNVKNMCFPAP